MSNVPNQSADSGSGSGSGSWVWFLDAIVYKFILDKSSRGSCCGFLQFPWPSFCLDEKVFTFDSDVLIDLFPRIYLFSLFDAKGMTETQPCRFVLVFVSFFSVSVLIFLPSFYSLMLLDKSR